MRVAEAGGPNGKGPMVVAELGGMKVNADSGLKAMRLRSIESLRARRVMQAG